MVGHHGEMPACQVVLEELCGCYKSQHLFICGAIPTLACVERFGCICNHLFDDTATLFLLLLQYGNHPCITDICRQDEVSVSSWICQNGCLYKSFLKSLEGLLTVTVPNELGIFLCQDLRGGVGGGDHGSKVRDVTAVVRCQSQEGTNVLESVRSRPILHSGSFHGVYFYPLSGHVMP